MLIIPLFKSYAHNLELYKCALKIKLRYKGYSIKILKNRKGILG